MFHFDPIVRVIVFDPVHPSDGRATPNGGSGNRLAAHILKLEGGETTVCER
jgi:hypothetical protein